MELIQRMSDKQSKKKAGSVTKAVTIENQLDDQSTMPIENSCGADGSRTHHLLKAVNLNLFQGFPFLEEVSSVLTTDSQSFCGSRPRDALLQGDAQQLLAGDVGMPPRVFRCCAPEGAALKERLNLLSSQKAMASVFPVDAYHDVCGPGPAPLHLDVP